MHGVRDRWDIGMAQDGMLALFAWLSMLPTLSRSTLLRHHSRGTPYRNRKPAIDHYNEDMIASSEIHIAMPPELLVRWFFRFRSALESVHVEQSPSHDRSEAGTSVFSAR